jgi:pilus assembly protein CpaF
VNEELTERLRGRFAADGSAVTQTRVLAALRDNDSTAPLGDTALLRLTDQIHSDLVGAGPLAPLLADQTVTDVLVNGVQVWVDQGKGLRPAPFTMPSAEQTRRLAQRLAAAAGRRLDDASPFADARLPDGSRLHAVLPPIATSGPYLSLRTFRQRPRSLAELVEPPLAQLLAAIVAARLTYLISGGTGSGKTTLLGALLALVPGGERIVLVEDSAELRPAHPHAIGLQVRHANVEGAGGVSLAELVRQALRMRPDRLVIGECRGAEVVDLLAALNTGHEGSAGTVHANSSHDVPARLEALGLLGGLPRAALHAQASAALQVLLHVRRGPAGPGTATGRCLDAVCLIGAQGPEHHLVVRDAWRRGAATAPAAAALARLLTDRGVRPPDWLGAP